MKKCRSAESGHHEHGKALLKEEKARGRGWGSQVEKGGVDAVREKNV